jgi:hypothetical protein
MTSKAKSAESAALSLLGVGAREQSARTPQRYSEPKKGKPQQLNIQLTPEGLAMLQQAQVQLLQRGVPRASFRGVVLETVLKDWLEAK